MRITSSNSTDLPRIFSLRTRATAARPSLGFVERDFSSADSRRVRSNINELLRTRSISKQRLNRDTQFANSLRKQQRCFDGKTRANVAFVVENDLYLESRAFLLE